MGRSAASVRDTSATRAALPAAGKSAVSLFANRVQSAIRIQSAIRNPQSAFKILVFVLSLGPFAWLIWAALTGNLSPNPLSDITNETGVWTLRFLCITLALTPLRRLTGWNALIKFRRMAGLFAFFYGTLHFLTYSYFDRLLSLIDFPDGYLSWDTAH